MQTWQRNIRRLRGPGARRAAKGLASSTLNALLPRLPKGATLLDVGCGESGDTKIANRSGYQAFSVDVVPPTKPCRFVQSTATALPFADNSFDGITSHAMVALLSPTERWNMYFEVARVLKPEGLFSITLFPLADGFELRNTVEFSRIFESGLHRVATGIYTKCSIPDCKEHPDPDSWDGLLRGIKLIDTNKDFVHTASRFVAWIINGCSPSKAASFAGVPESEIFDVIKGAQRCGILTKENDELVLDLPWLTLYSEDQIREGNISLILDTLCILGQVERSKDDSGETLYKNVEHI